MVVACLSVGGRLWRRRGEPAAALGLTWQHTLQDSWEAPLLSARSPGRSRDRAGQTLYVVNTHPGSRAGRSLGGLCEDERVYVCTDAGSSSEHLGRCHEESVLTSTSAGYTRTSYKLTDCLHEVCARNTNFSLVKMDDDVVLGSLVERGVSQCDVVEAAISTDPEDPVWQEPGTTGPELAKRYWVDGLDTLKTRQRANGLPVAAICLSYFWYLNVADSNSLCDSLHLLRHYRAEDVSFSQLFARLGLQMRDIRDDFRAPEIPVGADSDGCFNMSNNAVVPLVQCPRVPEAARLLFD